MTKLYAISCFISVVNFAFANLGRRKSVVLGIHVTDDLMILDHVPLKVWLGVNHIRKIGGISKL